MCSQVLKKTQKKLKKVKILFLLLIVFGAKLGAEEPEALYLSWQGNPATTMTVFWITKKQTGQTLLYQEVGTKQWFTHKAEGQKFGALSLYCAQLTNLKPNSLYQLRFEEKVYSFKTLPETLHRAMPLKVVVGGDAFFTSERSFRKMNEVVAKQDPDFVILGGDIAYTKEKKGGEAIERWITFFKTWTEQLVTSDGKLIPIVAVPGNHDGELFRQVFGLHEGPTYRTLQIGSLVFFLLDTDHFTPVGGEQEKWLGQALQTHADVLYKVPVYHVAAYPSFYPFEGKRAEEIRKTWVPLFEKAGVRLCFEHHNHCFKRTFPLKEGKIDEEGIVFAGDGSWGVIPRMPRFAFYLKKALPISAVWLLRITTEKCELEAISQEGKKIDAFTLFPSVQGKRQAELEQANASCR